MHWLVFAVGILMFAGSWILQRWERMYRKDVDEKYKNEPIVKKIELRRGPEALLHFVNLSILGCRVGGPLLALVGYFIQF